MKMRNHTEVRVSLVKDVFLLVGRWSLTGGTVESDWWDGGV